jgi:hypothetical protein
MDIPKIVFSIGWHHSKESRNVYPITLIHHFFRINLVELISTTYGLKQVQISREHFCMQNFERLGKLDFPLVINDGI